jgi:hypothetical protein
MSTRYESSSWPWHYCCYGESSKGQPLCWSVPGAPVDQAVEQLFLQTMVPSELELSLAVEREVQVTPAMTRRWDFWQEQP